MYLHNACNTDRKLIENSNLYGRQETDYRLWNRPKLCAPIESTSVWTYRISSQHNWLTWCKIERTYYKRVFGVSYEQEVLIELVIFEDKMYYNILSTDITLCNFQDISNYCLHQDPLTMIVPMRNHRLIF